MASKLADEVASIATYPQFFPTRGGARDPQLETLRPLRQLKPRHAAPGRRLSIFRACRRDPIAVHCALQACDHNGARHDA